MCYAETMSKSTSAFTIVELLVVITVIGILSTIAIASFSGFQTDSRDTQRSSRTTLIAEALEKYYDKNGEYPSCSALTQSAAIVNTSVLPGIDPLALLTPKSASSDTNSIKCTDLTGASTDPDVFAYVGDGSANCITNTGTSASCLSWTLKYIDESTGVVKTLQSRRNTAIATSGASTLTASGAGFTQVNASWSTINNAVSYAIQWATDAGFTTNLGTQTVSGISANITGLTYNTQYYFRVRPNAAIGQGNWSNTKIASTWIVGTPTLSATTNSSTVFTSSWPATNYATSYTLQLSSDGTTWSTGWQATTASTAYSAGGANQGYKYYVRVQALNGGYTSGWSNVASTVTTIDAPAAPIVTQSSTSTTTTFSWSAVSCPSGTSAKYRYEYGSSGPLGYGSLSGFSSSYIESGSSTSVSLTTSAEGYNYNFYASAGCTTAVTSSGWGGDGTVVYYRPVNNPGAVSIWLTRGSGSADLHASSSCTGGTYADTTADPWIGSGYNWDTGVGGWWADSHSGTWMAGWNYYGTPYTQSITGNFPSGTLFALRAYFRCHNYNTKVMSGTSYGQSGQMALP